MSGESLDREAIAYREYHARRYAVLLDVVRTQLAGVEAPRILDVGPNAQTALLRRVAAVDTLGYEHPIYRGDRHVEVDLNAPDGYGDGSYDAVVMAEVIEHLHTAAPIALRYLATWLRPGGVLVLQTPNAVALHKRVRMLLGRNPYEPIRTTPRNPGHFHEFTLGELQDAARVAGLRPEGRLAANYFGDSRLYAALGRVLPESLRHGITMWLRKP